MIRIGAGCLAIELHGDLPAILLFGGERVPRLRTGRAGECGIGGSGGLLLGGCGERI